MCQHHKAGLTNEEKHVPSLHLTPTNAEKQRSQINRPITKGRTDWKNKRRGYKAIAFSKKWKKTMSKWLRFLCSFCLHIIYTSILCRFVWTDPELFLLCWVDKVNSCHWQTLSFNLETYLRTKQCTHTTIQYKSAIRVQRNTNDFTLWT